jgi:pSer/pThr/pTyr-binding forkhead associated (FHA) protein
MEVKLIVLEGKHKNRVIPLPETIFLIGRDRQCHLRPHCQWVSKLHCAIAAWAGKVRVRDLKSRNGTLVNGQPIKGEVLVGDSDRLQVGTLIFAFRIKEEEGIPLVPPIREGDVRWLLDTPSDSAILSPSCQTALVPTSTTLAAGAEAKASSASEVGPGSPAAAANTRGTKAISAGKHLRDYFAKKKPPADPAANNGPSKN